MSSPASNGTRTFINPFWSILGGETWISDKPWSYLLMMDHDFVVSAVVVAAAAVAAAVVAAAVVVAVVVLDIETC